MNAANTRRMAEPTCPPGVATPCYWNNTNTNAYAGGGGLLSTIEDMATFVAATLATDTEAGIGSALRLMQRPAGFGPHCPPAPAAPLCQGLAWSIWPPGLDRPSSTYRSLEKDGATWGSAANTWILPDACWGMTVLTNSSSGTGVHLGEEGSVSSLLNTVGPTEAGCS